MAATGNPQLGIRQALAVPAFRKLWLAQMVSVFGDFLALYAVLSAMSFRMHASARAITLVTVFFLLPMALIGPVAGVFVDRWNPKRTLVTSDLARAVLALGLVIAGAPWHIYMVFFALSTFSSFFLPARSVVMPQIMPMEGLMSANAVMQQTAQMMQIASPAIAGALAGWAGPSVCYYLDSASFIFSAVMISAMTIPARPAHANRHVDSVLKDLFSGTRFILGHPVISFVILSIAAGTFAMSAFGSLTAVFVRDVLHSNSYLFGTLGSLIGLGMLGGGFVVAPLARRIQQKAHLVTSGILLCGISIGTIARIPNDVVALIGCLGIGVGASLMIIAATSLMQGQVPQEMRGRVSSSAMSLISISQGIALLFAGDLASRYGILYVFYGSAALLLAISLGGAIRLRKPLEAPKAQSV
jgi:DHA3 family macrolide efflux protein-like MFS transporter